MRTASWDGIPDPDEKAFGWHNTDSGWVSKCVYRLDHARWKQREEDPRAGVVVAWVDGQHIRCPDDDPPKPAPVITIDGVECEVVAWRVVDNDGDIQHPTALTTFAAAVELQKERTRDGRFAPYRIRAVVEVPCLAVLLPEEGT